MAGKKLINEAFILDAAVTGETSVTVPKDAILSPLARDTARERGITILFGDVPSSLVHVTPTAAERVIAIGSDHSGFDYKESLTLFLKDLDWKVVDVGTDSHRSCDFPDFAYAVGKMVAEDRAGVGIMIDGVGVGSAIVCNKIRGIRAACTYNEFAAWNARAHNNANVLTLGSRSMGIEVCKRIISTFLETEYEGGRHERRVRKMQDVEDRYSK
ncbi:MAG: ribose 5-phosphate isomerase B [Bacteroidetes bacterium]|nr:MAG: ribose 5-phosphate isomerase B [Bacteroidota bacterium]